MIATRDNEPAARAAALNTTRQKLIAFMISGGIAGFAGALFAVQQQGINSGAFTADIDIALFSMVVIGGLGSLPGVVLGAVVVWSAQYFLPSGYAALVNGGGILLLLIFLPEGLGGLLYVGRDQLLRLVARRHGIAVAGIWRGTGGGGPEAPSATVFEATETGSQVRTRPGALNVPEGSGHG